MRRVSGIALDLEGPTVKAEHFHRDAFYEVASEVGIDDFDFVPEFIGVGDVVICAHLSKLSGRNQDAIHKRKRDIFRSYVHRGKLEPRLGWREFRDSCKGLHLPMAIGSLTLREDAQFLLQHSGICDLFDSHHVVLREDVQRPKPAPDVYSLTAERLEIAVEEQLVIDDSVVGVKAGVAAGSIVIGMPIYLNTTQSLLDAGAVAVFHRWPDICMWLHEVMQYQCLSPRSRVSKVSHLCSV